MDIGIVGKPNTGKSTLFKAMTRTDVDAANYPFTTIEPNRGVGFITTTCPCTDREQDCDPNGRCIEGTRYVPITLLDIAGLVPGAAEGKGMGNEFLDAVRQASCLVHVIDASGQTNAEGEPVEEYDPVEDVRFIEDELDAWMQGLLEDGWDKRVRSFRSSGADVAEVVADQFSGLGVTVGDVRNALREVDVPDSIEHWDESDRSSVVTAIRAETKPMIIAANKIDAEGADENLERLREAFPDETIIPISAQAEEVLREADEAGKISYQPGAGSVEITDELSEKQEAAVSSIQESVLDQYGSTGVQELLNEAVFDLLDMIVVYPVEDAGKWTDQKGNMLPDAVLVQRGATPVDLAYAIHSDIGDAYVKAIDARSGRTLGRDQELENGDVVRIVT
ncbi:MAG: redox-regulated ATPase YchF [Candidatus Nanohaloarchaeota archaeon QJJ-5]|nr:redox-regulated ATPase YchF [Candidatus Nanohaloarchaeota archaeon QJJ-5]